MPSQHIWTHKDRHGTKREVRATKFGGAWKFKAKTAGEPEWNTGELITADKRFGWHPFTDMREWCAAEHEPLVLVEGRGALLRDSRGREYIDGNSSIWTNIHGHNHPHINAAIRRQLSRVAHTSFLGFTNPAAIELAQAIVALFPDTPLTKVF